MPIGRKSPDGQFGCWLQVGRVGCAHRLRFGRWNDRTVSMDCRHPSGVPGADSRNASCKTCSDRSATQSCAEIFSSRAAQDDPKRTETRRNRGPAVAHGDRSLPANWRSTQNAAGQLPRRDNPLTFHIGFRIVFCATHMELSDEQGCRPISERPEAPLTHCTVLPDRRVSCEVRRNARFRAPAVATGCVRSRSREPSGLPGNSVFSSQPRRRPRRRRRFGEPAEADAIACGNHGQGCGRP